MPYPLAMFEIEDKFFESRINEAVQKAKVKLTSLQTPMFLTSRAQFAADMARTKKPFMKTFYEGQRKRLQLLVDKDQKPVGGQWSFDAENRKPLPKGHECPPLPKYKADDVDHEVFKVVDSQFPDHPGKSKDFWLPTDRKGARVWAKDFFQKRFELFGVYEDALSKDEKFLYHSVLTPYLNVGLMTPKDCIQLALKTYKDEGIPLNSCEGFVRQITGWREFVRGIYQNFSEKQETSNFFGHHRKLSSAWYEGNTGIEPLDDVISKVNKFGYAHHIERLMVVGSLMVLLEVEPQESYLWFMEMFIDSSDWVMVPNVFGMALFSDGGIFATKPYICGSNYYRKMSHYKAGAWCDGVDGLYWSFVGKHKDFFGKNPRMSMMARSYDKLPKARLAHLQKEAEKLKSILLLPEK
jgi:deoxyribodipyrimidine photolyase-related protein